MAATSEVKLVVQVVDQATAEIKKIADGFGGFKGAAGHIISLNQALALLERGLSIVSRAMQFPIEQFQKLATVSTDLVREYDDQIRAQTRLRTALRLQGDATGEQAERLIELASALQDVTRFDDDAIVSGQALAASAGIQADQLERFTNVAVDLAAALGEDVATGFQKLLIGVQTGSIRGFANNISDAVTESRRLNDVLSFGERNLNGMARALARVGAGPIDQAINAFDDFRQNVGKVISQSDEFQAFILLIKDASESASKFVRENAADLGSLFGKVFAFSVELATRSLEVFIRGINAVIEAASDAKEFLLGLKILGADIEVVRTARIPGAGAAARAERDRLKKELADFVVNRGRGVGDDFDSIINDLNELGKRAQQEIFPGGLGKAFDQAREKVKDTEGAATDLGGAVSSSSNAMSDLIAQLREVLDPSKELSNEFITIKDAVQDFAGTGDTGIDFLLKQLDDLAKRGKITKDQFDQLAASIRNAFAAQSTRPIGGGGGGGSAVPGAPSVGGGGGGGGGIGAGGGSGQALAAAAESIRSAGAEMSQAAAAQSAAAANSSFAAAALRDAAAGLGSSALGFFEVAGMLGEAAIAIEDSASESKVAIVSSALASYNVMIVAARRLWQGGNKIVTGREAPAPFDRGGIAIQPLVGILAERRPEAVIPLDRRGAEFARSVFGGSRGERGGETVIVNVNVDRLELSDSAADDLVQRFSRRVADLTLETTRRR